MKFTKPKIGGSFLVTTAAEWPSIKFETDGSGPHTWTWSIVWGTFKASGKATTTGNQWDAKDAIKNLGGTLTVKVDANKASATIAVTVKGQNPTASEATSYLATKANSAGFDKILAAESKYKQFDSTSNPVKSFDGGYGMCQLTNPVPSYQEVWNWKLNIDAGLKLFGAKRTTAINYLSQSKRSYTIDQLKYESVCRWNGGAYHEWDAKAGKWVRQQTILCDTASGNIGWDMTDAQNKGKSATDLHKRDSGSYGKAPTATAHWKYFGVCYADHILG